MAAVWLDADWPAPPSVRAFTTLRHGLGASQPPFDDFNLGNCTAAQGDDPATVERNRALLVAHAGLPAAPHWLRQVHGVAVARFDAPPTTMAASGVAGTPPSAQEPEREPEADAAVTSSIGSVLAILTADCLPVLLCADDGSEVAAAHAGWRGLAGGVLEATIAAMTTPPGRLLAWLGPAAGPQTYEVGAEVHDAFMAGGSASSHAFTRARPGHWRVDLYALARQRLVGAGMAAPRIHGGGLCTIAMPDRFFSHRRDRRSGRMASLIWMDPGR